ncbi:MAG TPA: acetyl-CoA C-acyltransferase family protein [Rhodocyclaceae bacterium]|nr:acetyl-CoA C-acyltransferase family protein [Rhodocyclaceae bacterium]
MTKEVVVLSAVRSAVGGFGGSLKDMEPGDLGGLVIKEAIARAGLEGSQVTFATVGNVIPTEARYAYVSRLATIQGGMSMDSTVFNVNRLCGSAMQAIVSSAQAIMMGDAEFALGGGVEVMSRGGYMLPALRTGARMGDAKAIDMMVSVLTDPFGVGHMGITAENLATKWGISREDQDAFALVSQERAAAAIAAGHFKGQIVPITFETRKGPVVFDTDEHPRMTTLEQLAKMKPAFKKDGGTVTAGNASGINDGAAFLVLADAAKAASSGLKPMARLVAYGISGVPNDVMGEGPIPATKLALKKAGLTLDQMDVIESNEAFAAQSLAVCKGLDMDPAKANPNGGAIALGHPVGATGSFIVTKALHELQRIGGRYALVTMCIGGGQGITTIYERI